MTKAITPRQRDILLDMAARGFVRPMDIGAHNGSHHSATLGQLVRKGLVEKRTRGSVRSFRYRLTEKGNAEVAVLMEAERARAENLRKRAAP
jgi:chromosome segregation and condensation protein ScpB